MKMMLRAISLGIIAAALMSASVSASPNAEVVVVYPLTTDGSTDPHVGEQIASLISADLQTAGGVAIREPSSDVSRQGYLETARRLGADYYLSGFVTKISGQLSVVEQLVSTLSNTTVWSNDARLVTTDDARAQGELVRSAILGHAGRALAAFDPGVKPSPIAAAPAGAPAQVAVAPTNPSFAVLLTGGTASEKDRAYADAAIVKTLRGRGFVADVLSDPSGDLSVLGPAICASTGVMVLLGGNVMVDVQPDREINQWATAKLDLSAYDCSTGRPLSEHSAVSEAFNWNWAVDQAVAVALRSFAAGAPPNVARGLSPTRDAASVHP
jgi:TolB-like protein